MSHKLCHKLRRSARHGTSYFLHAFLDWHPTMFITKYQCDCTKKIGWPNVFVIISKFQQFNRKDDGTHKFNFHP